MIARVLGALVRLRPAAPLPTAAEHRARVEACRAEAARLPPERQSLIAQGDLCHARALRAEREVARLRGALCYYGEDDHYDHGDVPGHVYILDDHGKTARAALRGWFAPLSLSGENAALRATLGRLHAAVAAYGRIGFEGSDLLEVMSEARELLDAGDPR